MCNSQCGEVNQPLPDIQLNKILGVKLLIFFIHQFEQMFFGTRGWFFCVATMDVLVEK